MLNQYKILIVDDEEEILSLLQRYLKLEGFAVETCSSPKEALRKLEAENFKVLITDLVMPEMGGWELIRQAKEMNGFLQVIAMTGYVPSENIMNAFKYGANNCFFKPFASMDMIKQEILASISKLERIKEVLSERIKRKA